MQCRYFIAAILAARFALAPAAAQNAGSPPVAAVAGNVDPAFVGHYYLSGIMETGSELLLRDDGSFEWYMSYGALDQFANGTWRRVNDRIVLAARQPDRDKPLFAYLDTQPWSAEAEQSRLDAEHDAQENAVRSACPFLADNVSVTAPVPTIVGSTENKKPTLEELRGKAEATLLSARQARSRMEEAARRIMAGNSTDEAAVREAHRVTAAWYEASDIARNAAQAAGLPNPDLSEPVLPSACSLPERRTVDPGAPESWKPGLAVEVIDPKSGNKARGVKIGLRSGDGKTVEVTTAGDGIALLTDFGNDAQLTATLDAPYAPGRAVEVGIPPVRYGTIRFSIDTEQLMAPPFERLTLRIDGAALLPEEFGRGRYTR
jgi:hypothetical protein